MNASNPFQVPSCFQINHEQRRRDRFKKAVLAGVVAGVLLLLGLLIEGCKSERAAAATPIAPLGEVPAAPVDPQTSTALTVATPAPVPHPAPAVVPKSVPPSVSKANAVASAGHPAVVYVVKAGDTLTRIARTHGTTVKAIEAANNLTTDRIVIGARLKLPEA
jgi:LysM repeat protein